MVYLEKDGKYIVGSHTQKKYYTVDIMTPSCSCPHWLYRLKSSKGMCKHILEVMDGELGDVELRDNMNALEFVERYGDIKLKILKLRGICYERKGMIHLF